MPADYRIDPERRRVLSSGSGVYSMDDALGHMNGLLKDPEYSFSFSQRVDFRGITEVALSHNQIFDLASRSVFSPGAKRAFVTRGPVQCGLVRMFQTYRSARGEQGIRVFTDIEEAVRWLDDGEAHAATGGAADAPAA